jgi:DNA-binding transcriptional LysR family regulator
MFLRRDVDVLLCYRTAHVGVTIPASLAAEIRLGDDQFIAVAHRTLQGTLASKLENRQPLPMLSYPESSFLGKVFREDCLPNLPRPCCFETVCESAFSAGLKEMVMNGMGIAWLPRRLVAEELVAGTLLDLSRELGAVDLQVLVYWNHSCRWKLPAASIETREALQ